MALAAVRAVRQPVVMLQASAGARAGNASASFPVMSLEARLARLHRRRHVAQLKRFLAAMGELLVGAALLLTIFMAAAALR